MQCIKTIDREFGEAVCASYNSPFTLPHFNQPGTIHDGIGWWRAGCIDRIDNTVHVIPLLQVHVYRTIIIGRNILNLLYLFWHLHTFHQLSTFRQQCFRWWVPYEKNWLICSLVKLLLVSASWSACNASNEVRVTPGSNAFNFSFNAFVLILISATGNDPENFEGNISSFADTAFTFNQGCTVFCYSIAYSTYHADASNNNPVQ